MRIYDKNVNIPSTRKLCTHICLLFFLEINLILRALMVVADEENIDQLQLMSNIEITMKRKNKPMMKGKTT